MSKVKKNKVVPRLRFPDFRGTEEWKVEPFSKLYSLKVTNSLSRANLNYEKGTIKNIHYGDIHTKFSTLFDITKEEVPYINTSISVEKIKPESYCKEGDLILADASEDMDDVGKSIEIINLNNEKLVSGLHTLLARPQDSKFKIGFGGYLFKSKGIRLQIQKESQGAKVLGLSGGRLSKIKVYYPSDEKEQQKLADCLISLDNLITAQREKNDTLKDYKKGLLQQLFPVEGERIPKLRFKGFKGDWEETTLSQVAKYENGKAHEQDIDKKGNYIVVNSKFISREGKVKKFTNAANCLAKKRDILMVLSDVPNGRAIAKCFFVDANNLYTVNQRIAKLTPEKANGVMLFYTLNKNPYFLAFDDGVKQTNLRKDTVLNCPILLPKDPDEQQEIADCLTSLDDLIKAQGEKLDSFKAHKKGLMQQLFPNPNE